MNSECTLVLGLLSDGRINVDEAERLIRRLTVSLPVLSRSAGRLSGRAQRPSHLRWPSHVKWPSHVPPHLPTGFGGQATNIAV